MAGSFLELDVAMEYLRIKQADQPGRYFTYNRRRVKGYSPTTIGNRHRQERSL